ncbi:hypothetical protein [Nonomuraea sp. CA-141351]|uniref:hypothetical protein n=1 Tax=Nonomuraea sp. CA-141351 TaxID=3239996 RepID=UPI003D947DDC
MILDIVSGRIGLEAAGVHLTRAAKHGRAMRFGVRLNLIVRDTDEQAWAAAT